MAKLKPYRFPEGDRLSKDDFVLIAGDFGCIWDGSDEDIYWQNYFRKKKHTTLFIDGNHENFDILESYPTSEWKGGKVRFINGKLIHLMRGQVYEIDNKKIFTFGGAKSIDKFQRQEGISWWKREEPSFLEYEEGLVNLEKHNNSVDYIVTHTCAREELDLLYKNGLLMFKASNNQNEYFSLIRERVNYKRWYFGHFHIDLNIDDKHSAVYERVLEI